MKKYPAYSVLMSVYKQDDPSYLDQSITSMVNQTVPFNDMVLVCDGPLTSEIESALEVWKKKLGEKLLIHRLANNSGLGVALSEGLPLCECEIVARMDADDISRPNRCELLLNALEERHLDVVGGAIEEFDKEPGDMGAIRRVPERSPEIERFAARRNPFNHVSVLYRRHVIEAVGGYESFLYLEDYWLWVRVIMGGGVCGNIPDVVVDVRTGSGMYGRRSNTAYLKLQMSFFARLREIGFINTMQYLRAVLERSAATFMPNRLVKAVYNRLLRVNARNA